MRQRKKTLDDDLKLAKQSLANLNMPTNRPGVLVDNDAAELKGAWKASKFSPKYVGAGYVHDDRLNKGEKSATFTLNVPADGEYELRISYTSGANRDPQVPVAVVHADGEEQLLLNQRPTPAIDGLFQPLKAFPFKKDQPATVTISNAGTTDYVIVDAVWLYPTAKAEPAQTESKESQAEIAAAEQRIKSLEEQLKSLKDQAPAPAPKAMAARDHEKNRRLPYSHSRRSSCAGRSR